MQEEKKKFKLDRFMKIVIAEIIVLAVLLVVSRLWLFPFISGMAMLHVQIAINTLMIGICATIFTVFAVFFKKEWRKSKKYIVLPVIFTVFGYLLLKMAEEISLI